MPNLVSAVPDRGDHKLQSRTLDVFKGLAAVAMVVNHSGFALLTAHDANSGLSGFAVFLGSFAPALFFFATGYGAGLRPIGESVDWASVWKKFAWLVLADQLLIWPAGHRFGMDFFGFIALSLVAVALVQTQRHASGLCIGAIAFLLLIRYPARTMVEGFAGQSVFLLWFTGVQGQAGWSYPLSPWLVAPLAGFWSARNLPRLARHWRTLLVAVVVAIGGLLSLVLYSRGFSFFRWGSVSAAYFVAGVTAVMVVWCTAGCVVRSSARLERPLSLRGASVFLVVPIHYGVLAMVKALELQKLAWSHWMFGLTGMVVLTVLALMLARRLADKLRAYQPQVSGAVGTAFLCGVVCLAGVSPAFSLGGALACAVAQCVIAARLLR